MVSEPLRDGLGRRRPDQLRHYTDQEKAQAVALGLTLGDDVAAAQLGIPRRNLSRWRRSSAPAVQRVWVADRSDQMTYPASMRSPALSEPAEAGEPA